MCPLALTIDERCTIISRNEELNFTNACGGVEKGHLILRNGTELSNCGPTKYHILNKVQNTSLQA